MKLQVFDPYSGELACELERDGDVAVERKLAAAAEAQRAWRRRPLPERVALVARGLELFRERPEEIALDLTRQMGKPIEEARAEVRGMLGRAEHLLSIAEGALAPDRPPCEPGRELCIVHEPLGVVLQIAPWNYPLLIAVNVVVPALVAGNAVLLKHSALTPLCGLWFERAFGALDPTGLVANVIASHEQCARLAADPRVAHVVFTGSVGGGHAIQRAASERFIDVGLELGGKDPAYVAEDAELDVTAAGIVDGACYNAGQSCCAVERVYVHRRRYEEFLARAEALAAGYRMGDPRLDTTTLGPMAQKSALTTLRAQVEDATRRGARLLHGGRALERRFFEPTLLADCAQESPVMQEESFGPLVPVRAVADDEEALRLMNDSRYGLTASVWTRDAQRAERFARELEAGTVFQNRCDFLDPALPWTGVKDSGKGSTLSRYGFLHLTRRKSLHFRRGG